MLTRSWNYARSGQKWGRTHDPPTPGPCKVRHWLLHSTDRPSTRDTGGQFAPTPAPNNTAPNTTKTRAQSKVNQCRVGGFWLGFWSSLRLFAVAIAESRCSLPVISHHLIEDGMVGYSFSSTTWDVPNMLLVKKTSEVWRISARGGCLRRGPVGRTSTRFLISYSLFFAN